MYYQQLIRTMKNEKAQKLFKIQNRNQIFWKLSSKWIWQWMQTVGV